MKRTRKRTSPPLPWRAQGTRRRAASSYATRHRRSWQQTEVAAKVGPTAANRQLRLPRVLVSRTPGGTFEASATWPRTTNPRQWRLFTVRSGLGNASDLHNTPALRHAGFTAELFADELIQFPGKF